MGVNQSVQLCIAHQTPTPKMGILEAVPLDYGGIVDCNNQGTLNYSMRYLLVPFENNLLFITYSCFSASPNYEQMQNEWTEERLNNY